MTSKKRDQIDRMLADIQRSLLPAANKAVIVGEILRASLPAGSHLTACLPPVEGDGRNDLSTEDLDGVIATIRAVLPAYEETGDPPDESQRQAELVASVKGSLMSSLFDLDDRVEKAMNAKFTRSPWFQICIAAAAVAITLFSFGLVNLNKDVKRADEIVSEFQQRLAKADQDLAKDERESNARLSASADNALSKLSQLQNDSMKGLNADLQRRIADVETAKQDAVADIDKAAKRVNDQATLAAPDIERAKKLAIDALNDERERQLKAYREKAGEIIANLREPSIRNVLNQSFWLMVVSMVLSVASLILVFRR
jgi:hypothetical protein